MKINKSQKLSKKLLATIIVCVVLVITLGYGVYAKINSTWPFTSDTSTKDDTTTHIENNKTSNNHDSTVSPDTEERVKNGGGSGQDGSSTSGSGVSDTDGSGVVKQSGGVRSKEGHITLYTPTTNQKLSSEVTVKGAANVSEIYYRINDTIHGMIGSGRLSVHNGYFSGKLSASTNAESGTFEVYSLNSQGQESNNISIEVKY